MTVRIDEHGCLIVGNCALPAAVVPAVEAFYRERFVAAGVVAEEPEGRRWFSAAYRAQNGNVIPIGGETVLAEFAQKTVDEFSREDDEGPDYFLASRILSPWVPVKQEGAAT